MNFACFGLSELLESSSQAPILAEFWTCIFDAHKLFTRSASVDQAAGH